MPIARNGNACSKFIKNFLVAKLYLIKKERERKSNCVAGRWKDTAGRAVFSNGIQQDNESMSMEIDSLIFHRGSFRAIQESAPRNSISKFNELLNVKYREVTCEGVQQKYTYLWHVCICVHISIPCKCTWFYVHILKHSTCKHMSFQGSNAAVPALPSLSSALRENLRIKTTTASTLCWLFSFGSVPA